MADGKELTQLTELLFTLHNHLTVWKNTAAAETDLSSQQINALEIIGHNYSLKMKQLAAKLGVTTGSLSVMVDRLEKKSLVERKPSEDDRRSIMVHLTSKGRAVFLARYKQQLEFINKNLAKTSTEDRKKIYASLKFILGQIRNEIQ